jgi:hypothetical protein
MLNLTWQDDLDHETPRGMIILHQEKNAGELDRYPIDKPTVIAAYAAAAAEIPNYPELPQHGFGSKGKYGDWFVYNDYDKCVEFVEEHPVLVVMWTDKDGCGPADTYMQRHPAQIQLTTKAVKLSNVAMRDGNMSADAANMYTVHISVNIPNGILFGRVNISHIRQYLSTMGFQVFKANRVERSSPSQ